MRPWTAEYVGRLEERIIESTALAGNPLGDSASRPLWVYLPPGYDDDETRRFPVIYLLQGYAAAIGKWNQRPAFGKTVPERFDEVFADTTTPPCIVAYVDAWTSLGGSQFIDSPAVGNYHSYLCNDVVGFVDANYRTIAEGARRGLQGHSSGGFGALVNAMLRPDLFGAIASHAGDAAYDLCYPQEIATAYRALRDQFGGSYENFFSSVKERGGLTRSTDFSLMMVYALSACFSPGNDGSVNLPFDAETGFIRSDIWNRWLSFDPVNMVHIHAEALQSLRGIWLDAGKSDENYFDVGVDRLAHELRGCGVTNLSVELFEGRHSGIEYRYPLALRYLADKLS